MSIKNFKVCKTNFFFPHGLDKAVNEVVQGLTVKGIARVLDTFAYNKLLFKKDVTKKSGYYIWPENKIKRFLKSPSDLKGDKGYNTMYLALGELLLNQLSKRVDIQKYFPYNDIALIHSDGFWELRLRSLSNESLNGMKFYYSKHKPKVKINEQDYIISFTPHAIERIAERMFGDIRYSYGANADIFDYLYGEPHFELVELNGGQLALSIFADLTKTELNQIIYKPYLSDEYCNYQYYRLGYFPIVLEGKYAICKTMLAPGYKKTPEYTQLKSKFSGQDNLQDALNLITSYDFGSQLEEAMKDGGVKNVLDYLDKSGIPQTISSDEKLSTFYLD